MKIAIDVNYAHACIELVRRGYLVVHIAPQGVNDERWLNEALDRGADTFVSQDVDVKNFALNRNLTFIYVNPTLPKDRAEQSILSKISQERSKVLSSEVR